MQKKIPPTVDPKKKEHSHLTGSKIVYYKCGIAATHSSYLIGLEGF